MRPLPLFTAALVGLIAASPAQAQLDYGKRYIIVQDRQVLGEVLVPDGQDHCSYVEYWFVHEGFTFVGPSSGASFTVEVVGKAEELEGWEAALWAEHPGGRMLLSKATESRPGCR
jgi:hypothetical protein